MQKSANQLPGENQNVTHWIRSPLQTVAVRWASLPAVRVRASLQTMAPHHYIAIVNWTAQDISVTDRQPTPGGPTQHYRSQWIVRVFKFPGSPSSTKEQSSRWMENFHTPCLEVALGTPQMSWPKETRAALWSPNGSLLKWTASAIRPCLSWVQCQTVGSKHTLNYGVFAFRELTRTTTHQPLRPAGALAWDCADGP